MAEIDNTTAWHGRNSLRVHFHKAKPVTLRTLGANKIFEEQARQITVGNVGWVLLAAGERYVFSCYVKADHANTPVRLLVYRPCQEILVPLASISAKVGTDWKRITLPVRANEATSVWVAAGLDMR